MKTNSSQRPTPLIKLATSPASHLVDVSLLQVCIYVRVALTSIFRRPWHQRRQSLTVSASWGAPRGSTTRKKVGIMAECKPNRVLPRPLHWQSYLLGDRGRRPELPAREGAAGEETGTGQTRGELSVPAQEFTALELATGRTSRRRRS